MIRLFRCVAHAAALVLATFSCPIWADEIKVAVASNFSAPAKAIAGEFKRLSEDSVVLITGSTGKLYAQIINGAPFDVFLAADTVRPQLLEAQGEAIEGSRFTYARGALVLWSPIARFVDASGKVLGQGDFRHLAIAHPVHAPYGAAARQVLEALGLWSSLDGKIVRGENIAQAFQFVISGNAKLGFVARSQIIRSPKLQMGSYWVVPQRMYSPIDQQAVVLTDSNTAQRFMAFLRGPAAAALIREFGYSTANVQ